MFKICVTIFLVSALLTVKSTPTSNGPNCEKWGIHFEEGHTITNPEQCVKATCVSAKDNIVETLECPVFKIRAECHLTGEDLTKEYPDCCRQVVCPPGLVK